MLARKGLGKNILAMQEYNPGGLASWASKGSHVVGLPCELGLLAHQLGLEVLLVDHDVSRPHLVIVYFSQTYNSFATC